MDNQLTMRLATPDMADRIMEILEDGKRSIARLGIDQWQHGYPNLDSVRQDMEMGACYVAVDQDGELLGTLALHRGVDPEYCQAQVPWLTDNPSTEPVPYAVIHRSATAANALNRGVMGFMFDQAAQIARAEGKQSIRIDTHPGNKAMRGLLAKHGYTEIGPFDLACKGDTDEYLGRIAYEKML